MFYLEGPTGSFSSDPHQVSSLHCFNQGGPQDVWTGNEPELINRLCVKKSLKWASYSQ